MSNLLQDVHLQILLVGAAGAFFAGCGFTVGVLMFRRLKKLTLGFNGKDKTIK